MHDRVEFDRCAPLGESSGMDGQLDWCRGARLRDQLIEEVRALETRLEMLRAAEGAPDFSMQQTCREMIQSRQVMIRQLPR